MTDKTPKKNAKNLVNTQATSAKTTDTERDSEPQPTNLPSADDLKERFKAGSIPLQTDFADIIDLANIGRQAVGGTESQDGPADGFTLSEKGLLQLMPNENKGISVDEDGVAVKADKGIEVDSGGVAVKGGDGIEVNEKGVAVKAGEGIEIDSNGVSLPLGAGLNHSSTGLEIKCKTNGGLRASKDGTSVIPGQGINLSSTGVGVKAAAGIKVSDNGVSVGLTNDQSGLSTDENNGLVLNKNAWIRTMCGLHSANFYAVDIGVAVFFCNFEMGCVAYVYGREGKYLSEDRGKMKLNNIVANRIMTMSASDFASIGTGPDETKMIGWLSQHAAEGFYFKGELRNFVHNTSYEINLKLISAPHHEM